jgi:hypothetical protein
VQLDETQYVADLEGKVPPVPMDELGPVVGTVECTLSDLKFHSVPGPAVNGDAALIGVGTTLHAVRGYSRSCRIAAAIAGSNHVYVAHEQVAGVARVVACTKAP